MPPVSSVSLTPPGPLLLAFETATPKGIVVAVEHPTAGTLCGVCVWRDADSMGVELQLPRRELERLLTCICLVL